MLHLQRTGELCADQAIPVCNTPLTTNAAFDLLVGLCVSCVPNMKLLVHMLTDMFYSGLFMFKYSVVIASLYLYKSVITVGNGIGSVCIQGEQKLHGQTYRR